MTKKLVGNLLSCCFVLPTVVGLVQAPIICMIYVLTQSTGWMDKDLAAEPGKMKSDVGLILCYKVDYFV